MHIWEVQPVDELIERELSRNLLLSPLQARLLATRGIRSVADGVRFLKPSLESLHDPFLFNEMEEAARLLHEAISRRERILVHGDYDADGVCGTALLFLVLEKLGADVGFFVPDRAKDGYGLAARVMDRSLEAGVKLVVSVDCGSSDRDVVVALAERGVKVLITDHHETGSRVPEAHAFINPKLPGERYPFKELTGSGVAFKLLQGLERRMGLSLSLEEHLDLVALGTLGDSGAMVDENRVLVSLGLDRMRKWQNPGLRALRARSKLPMEGFSPRQVSFTIIPRLNSPGRIAGARTVVELLVTADVAEADRIANEIEKSNERRKELGNSVIEEAIKSAEYRVWKHEPSALVFCGSDWHQGVVGIAAARLAERYNLPAVLIAVQNGLGKGSVRSAGRVNVKEALERCAEHLLDFGGHREAGGFSIREEAIPDFQKMFEEVVGELCANPAAPCVFTVDAEASLGETTMELVNFIERLGPFGMGNPEPVLEIRGIDVLEEGTRIVKESHLKIGGCDRKGECRELIGFSLSGAWQPKDIVGRSIDVLINLRRNTYQGKVEPQLQVMSIRYAE